MKKHVIVLLLIIAHSFDFLARPSRITDNATQKNKELIENLYNNFNINGFVIGSHEDSLIISKGGDPTYGEITYDAVQTILNDITLTKDDVFYDLGCGVGKACVQVALETPATAIGVELSPTRVHDAQKVRQELINTKKIVNPKRLQFRELNILDDPMSDATIIYLPSTCFSDDLMNTLTQRISLLPKNNVRVLTLRRLPVHKDYVLEKTYHLPMTWSSNEPVYLYKVKKHPMLAQTRK